MLLLKRTVTVLFCLVISGSSLVVAQDNVEAPWGAANGDMYGRARSDTIPMDFGGGAELAWEYDPTQDLGGRPAGRSSIVFDAKGNLYWHTGNAKLMSISPDGVLRWRASDSAGATIFLWSSLIMLCMFT